MKGGERKNKDKIEKKHPKNSLLVGAKLIFLGEGGGRII